jgi:hypothetical protein
MNITLMCWHCGASKNIEVNRAPAFAFEVATLADQAGMKGFIDMAHGRSLVFCNGDHARQQMTKTGQFRRRQKRDKEQQR